ncbi:tRNA1(Val) (adenine(37)-N6)-methyltransferase [Roseovarius sp. EL26]|uniref:tRNA1(Val) (adenine(37)-N6)-methyltransferase n=1 Tax=Roseovarius sp. EL26 TaxID=2126672 RepID=UPI000EA2B893|nr:methyltransferase [Roseovarius sp. EL26]
MADLWSQAEISQNDFLGGRLKFYQPRQGYRSGMDAVLLAASVPARVGDSVLELGCGAGVAILCLGHRVQGTALSGLELQPRYAALAQRNATENNLELQLETGDLAQPPKGLKQQQFDHVLANPPYFLRANSTKAPDTGRETAMGEDTPLATWVEQAAKRTKPKGTVTFIQRADRLPELLTQMAKHLGGVTVLPLIPRPGKPARLVLVQGRKGGRAAFCLRDGWVLHDGSHHDGDRENHSKATSCVLREGQPMPLGEVKV